MQSVPRKRAAHPLHEIAQSTHTKRQKMLHKSVGHFVQIPCSDKLRTARRHAQQRWAYGGEDQRLDNTVLAHQDCQRDSAKSFGDVPKWWRTHWGTNMAVGPVHIGSSVAY